MSKWAILQLFDVWGEKYNENFSNKKVEKLKINS